MIPSVLRTIAPVFRRCATRYLLLFLLLPLSTLEVIASDLQQATEQARSNIHAGASSQKKIDLIEEATQQLFSQYKNKLQQLESLNAYNRQLDQLVEQQRIEETRLAGELQRVVETQRKILPLIERMTFALEQFVALDIPFLPKERSERIKELKSLIQRPDISTAEKFRRVMEAYQIENEYGRTLEAYQGILLTEEQTKRTVNFLKIGRVILMYQTLNGEQTTLWNQETRTWQPLDASQFNTAEVKHAFQVARRQASPDLLMLPVPAPEQLIPEIAR
ncbi:MAG: DUF3450 domain-containing protein [Pseudomonadales bacterium]|nr:DUF3450 domain-containing protein [Pseudomonadales bacterium]